MSALRIDDPTTAENARRLLERVKAGRPDPEEFVAIEGDELELVRQLEVCRVHGLTSARESRNGRVLLMVLGNGRELRFEAEPREVR